MEMSLKTGFAQIFSCCPKNLNCPKFWGATAPLAPPARTPMTWTASARASWLLSNGDGDCVTFHRLPAYHLFLTSYFDATLTTGIARGTYTS